MKAAKSNIGIEIDKLIEAFRLMATAKAMTELFEENKAVTSKYVHATSRGHEAIQLAVGMQLKPCDFISPYYKIFEAGWFSRFTRNKVPVQVWTVNDVESIRTLINQQVHSIVTDIPEVAIGIRKSLSNESE